MDGQFYFQIELRNSKEMILLLRTICFLCRTSSTSYFDNIHITHAYDLIFLGNPIIADFGALKPIPYLYLKNSMTMGMHRKFFIYKIIHIAHITHGLIVDPVVFLDPDPVLEIR